MQIESGGDAPSRPGAIAGLSGYDKIALAVVLARSTSTRNTIIPLSVANRGNITGLLRRRRRRGAVRRQRQRRAAAARRRRSRALRADC